MAQQAIDELLDEVYTLIEIVRIEENLKWRELAQRLGQTQQNMEDKLLRRRDIKLSTVAKIFHKMNKRVRIIVEDANG